MPTPGRSSPVRIRIVPNIAELIVGHEFPPAQRTLRPQDVALYLDAVGDEGALYRECGYVPPTALVAYALGELFRAIDLPAGSIHSAQELSVSRPVASNEAVVFRIRLTRNTIMRGMRFLSVEFTGEDADLRQVIEGKSVVVVPGEGGEAGGR